MNEAGAPGQSSASSGIKDTTSFWAGNVLTLSDPRVLICETKSAEASRIIYLAELQLYEVLTT